MAKDEETGKAARRSAKKAARPEPEEPVESEPATPEGQELEKEEEEGEEEEAREGREEKEAAPKAKAAKKSKKAAKGDEGAEDEEDAPASGAKKGKSRARPRPKIAPELAKALKLRAQKNAQRPEFHRQEWFRYQRLGDKWRAPQGIQSKMRRHWRTHADVVSIGYRGPKAARGLHPSGFREVLVHNAAALESVDPAQEAVRIAASVGKRKREEIQDDAKKLGIRVLNWKVF